ncbi:MAG TPA: ATP-binding protein [Ktedonobacteraceae bacterium]|nr:ATP-binding protein [Ktedonobacteraceae bacterium]
MANLILDSLEIRNFRAFHDLKIEHLRRINLIVGKNNVGKTSLLEAIRLYAGRASTPTFAWDIMEARHEVKQPFVNVRDMLAALRYLFYGRNDIKPGLQPIRIGPLNLPPEDTLSIVVDWTITETRDGTLHTRLLRPGEDYTDDNLSPRFTIQAANANISYPIDPSLSQSILRLNSNEIACMFAPANGLTEQRLTELWDNIALKKPEADVLTALRLITPGLVNLNFISTPLSRGERIPIVKIADIDEPLPLYSLGDGMLRTLGISLALVNATNGFLLIDEFENGLHYAVQSDLWRLVFQIAHSLNVQVFATTHSWDSIEAFQSAAHTDTQDTGMLIRLESRKSGIGATLFDQHELGIVTREQIEVR